MFYWTQNPTPEGLLIDQTSLNLGPPDDLLIVCEVGRSDYIVHQYEVHIGPSGECSERDEPVDFLLDRITELESLCRETIGATGSGLFDYSVHQWNRDAALQRLSRWIKEHQNEISRSREEELFRLIQQESEEVDRERALHEAKLKQGTDADPPLQRAFDILGNKIHADYVIQERADRVTRCPLPGILIRGGLPETLSILTEAGWVFLEGYFRAAVALCRVALEEVLTNVATTYMEANQSVPILKDKLFSLINSLPDGLLPQPGKDLAHRVRKQGNDAVHTLKNEIGEEEAWTAILNTFDLTTALVDSLHSKGLDYPF